MRGLSPSSSIAKCGATVLQERRTKLTNSQDFMSTATTGIADPPDAPQAGLDLRTARERLGWPLSEVALVLRIRATYIAALEEGRLGLLPGNAYALGFLRTYANFLGLDPDEMLRRFKAEASGVSRRTELAFPAPVPERGLPAGAVVLLGLLLVVGVYAGWYRLSGEGRLPAETTMAVPERLAPLAEQAVKFADPAPPPKAVAPLAVTTAPPYQVVAPSAFSPNAALAAPVNLLPTGSMAPGSAPAAPIPGSSPSGGKLPDGATSPGSVASGPGPAAAPPAPIQGTTDQARLVLRATADAWIQVKDRAGPILLNRILKAGETWAVPGKPNLLLTTGNAGGTEILLDGVAIASLGGSGAVRRDLPLDPDLLRDGKLATGIIPVAAARSQQ